MKRVLGIIGVAAVVVTLAIGARIAYLDYRQKLYLGVVELISKDINNPEVEVRLVANSIVLSGWASEQLEKDRAVVIAKTYAELPHVFDLSAHPSVVDVLELKPKMELTAQQRWLRKICEERM